MSKYNINDIVYTTIDEQNVSGRVTAIVPYHDGVFYAIEIDGTLFKGVSGKKIWQNPK